MADISHRQDVQVQVVLNGPGGSSSNCIHNLFCVHT